MISGNNIYNAGVFLLDLLKRNNKTVVVGNATWIQIEFLVNKRDTSDITTILFKNDIGYSYHSENDTVDRIYIMVKDTIVRMREEKINSILNV